MSSKIICSKLDVANRELLRGCKQVFYEYALLVTGGNGIYLGVMLVAEWPIGRSSACATVSAGRFVRPKYMGMRLPYGLPSVIEAKKQDFGILVQQPWY
jgi:hypothetical protein